MQKEINNAITKINNQQRRMYIRRVMWLDMEDRIRKVYASANQKLIINKSPITIYLITNASNQELFAGKRIPSRVEITNTISIFVSSIHYPIIKTFGEKAPEHVFDSGAALWFSQSPSGGVSVFMSPFSSALHKTKEKELLIKSYDEPNQLTEEKLKNHLCVFFRYLTETNMAAPPSIIGYLFRQRIVMADQRNRSELFKLIAQLLSDFLIPIVAIIIGAAVTIATAK